MKYLAPVILSVVAVAAFAQAAPPFFNGNNAIFDPEISVVESGAKLDAQATVSAVRKYVTMTMRPQLASLTALREFTFQNAPRGIVGLPPVANQMNPNPNPQPQRRGNGAAARAEKAPAPAPAPAAAPAPATRPAAAAAPSVLEREGMFRLVLQPERETASPRGTAGR